LGVKNINICLLSILSKIIYHNNPIELRKLEKENKKESKNLEKVIMLRT